MKKRIVSIGLIFAFILNLFISVNVSASDSNYLSDESAKYFLRYLSANSAYTPNSNDGFYSLITGRGGDMATKQAFIKYVYKAVDEDIYNNRLSLLKDYLLDDAIKSLKKNFLEIAAEEYLSDLMGEFSYIEDGTEVYEGINTVLNAILAYVYIRQNANSQYFRSLIGVDQSTSYYDVLSDGVAAAVAGQGINRTLLDEWLRYMYNLELEVIESIKIEQNKTYQITFDSNCNDVNSYSYIYDTSQNNWHIPELTRNNYLFAGWYWDSAGTVSAEGTITIDRDLRFYAKWIPRYTTITFDSNCDYVDNTICTYDILAEDWEEPEIERPGYIFQGWYWDSACTNKVTTYYKTENHIFYAKWIPRYSTITFKSNCSTVDDIICKYDNLEEKWILPNITRPGYIFSGWYKEPECINKMSSVLSRGNQTYYAKWTKQYEYSVSYNKATITDLLAYESKNSNAITDLILPDTIDGYPVAKIGNGAFKYTTITGITLPDSIESIDNYAFSECKNLESIQIPDSVTYIGRGAFEYCTSLMSIAIPNGIEYIEDNTFIACKNLKNVDLPNSINFIGDFAFCGCESLLNIPISNTMTSIGNYVYADCYGITNFDIPNTIKSIGRGAFSNCHNIINVVIPDSVTSIKYAAFGHCLGLTNVFIPNSVTHIEDGAFVTCDNLSNITVDENNMYFSSLDGHLLNKNKTKFIRYAIGKSDITYTIPNEVVSIADYAFGISVSGYTKLKELVIPNTVTHIGQSAFPPSLSTIYYSGSTSEWRNILIGKNNSSLSTAKIIYNCKYITDTMLITDDKTTTNICIRPEECFYGATIVIAIYNDNKLVGIKAEKMTSYSEINYSHNSEHDTIKIMYLDNLSNLRPLKKNLNISSFNW